jgi:DNA-binding XRE family transcriptional regulator
VSVCAADGCEREIRCKGLCTRCYQRSRRVKLTRAPRTCGSGNSADPPTPLAARLKGLRLSIGLTQRELEPFIGSWANRISDWELGVHTPTLETLQKYAQLFNVTVSQLLDGVM